MKCRNLDCNKEAAMGKVYCIKHLQGQRVNNPIRANESKYGKTDYKNKKKKNNE